jgi:hypothetical protein
MPDDKLSSTENQDAKRSARESRLSIRNANKEVLRRELQDLSKVHCVQQIRSFGDCAKREGLMVIFRCRKENKLSENIICLIN